MWSLCMRRAQPTVRLLSPVDAPLFCTLLEVYNTGTTAASPSFTDAKKQKKRTPKDNGAINSGADGTQTRTRALIDRRLFLGREPYRATPLDVGQMSRQAACLHCLPSWLVWAVVLHGVGAKNTQRRQPKKASQELYAERKTSERYTTDY